MPKTSPFRKISVDEPICAALERRKAHERRHESLTGYICEILDLYLNGLLERSKQADLAPGALVTAAGIERKVNKANERKTGNT